jgi:2'-5' RNA ligase
MPRRIFIAINLPEDTKEKLIDFEKNWPQLPIRWVAAENIHLTLLFLGYLNENQLLDTLKTAEKIASLYFSFSLNFEKICYGPPDKKPPRMVWLKTKKNPELLALQKDLEKNLFYLPSFQYKQKENREYSPHITLGRIKQWEFRRLEPEERPEIDKEISLSFPVNSVEIMESRLKREGAEYTILTSIKLKS